MRYVFFIVLRCHNTKCVLLRDTRRKPFYAVSFQSALTRPNSKTCYLTPKIRAHEK